MGNKQSIGPATEDGKNLSARTNISIGAFCVVVNPTICVAAICE
jgi:hypothetical protein